jgi:hypothetical protein
LETHRNCSNCGGHLDTDVKHCPHCGQKQPLADLSFSAMMSDVWLVMTNIDNSFFRTLKDIWMPWKLTARYIDGQRKKYINPFRLFIILLLIFTGLMVSLINFDNIDFFKRFTDYKSIKTIHTGIAEVETKFPGHDDIFKEIDSIFIKNEYLVEGDTLFDLHIGNKLYILNMDDVLNKDMESVYEKYEVMAFYEKVIYKQTLKALRDPLGAMRYIFGNLTWTIILCNLLLAAFFKLLYFRQKKIFAEHLVLLCNIHSLSFLINILLLLAATKMSVQINYLTYMFVFPPIIFLLSVKKYYKNGLMLTVFKSFLAGMTYLLAFSLFITLVSLISFFIF